MARWARFDLADSLDKENKRLSHEIIRKTRHALKDLPEAKYEGTPTWPRMLRTGAGWEAYKHRYGPVVVMYMPQGYGTAGDWDTATYAERRVLLEKLVMMRRALRTSGLDVRTVSRHHATSSWNLWPYLTIPDPKYPERITT